MNIFSHFINFKLFKIRRENPTCFFSKTATVTDSSFGQYVSILDGAKVIGSHISDFTYVGESCSLNNVSTGKFCSIGRNVIIGLGKHPVNKFVSTYPAFYSSNNQGCILKLRDDNIFDESVSETLIGNDVWIGTNVIISGGVKISDGAVIAAGSVIVKDVEPYTIVGGNPAQTIRTRFSNDQIKVLLESYWWNWPIDKLKKEVNKFSDINEFISSL